MIKFVAIIPACNEAQAIAPLLGALREIDDGFLAIVSANGCTDRTVDAARDAIGDDSRFIVVDSNEPGKCRALNRAEDRIPPALLEAPRFFIDADIRVAGQDLLRLAARLDRAEPLLVSPRIAVDLDGCTPVATLAARGWKQRPYFRNRAFQFILGVNAAGRARWGRFPEIVADDAFVASHFGPNERLIEHEAIVTVRLPRTGLAFLGLQRRWVAGDRELRLLSTQHGYSASRQHAERDAPRRCDARSDPLATAVYLGIRGAAMVIDRLGFRQRSWYRDASSRVRHQV